MAARTQWRPDFFMRTEIGWIACKRPVGAYSNVGDFSMKTGVLLFYRKRTALRIRHDQCIAYRRPRRRSFLLASNRCRRNLATQPQTDMPTCRRTARHRCTGPDHHAIGIHTQLWHPGRSPCQRAKLLMEQAPHTTAWHIRREAQRNPRLNSPV